MDLIIEDIKDMVEQHDCEKCMGYENCKIMCFDDTIMVKCIFYQTLKDKIRNR